MLSSPIHGFIHVPHLDGIDAHYALAEPFEPPKPTALLICGFMTSLDLFEPQLTDPDLRAHFNLLAIDPLGHGRTKSPQSGQFNYWDTAIVFLQVMEALTIKRAFLVGTAQGGWIATRMALLAGDKIQGIVMMGTSLDGESARSRSLGCWDGNAVCDPQLEAWYSPAPTPDWVIPEDFVNILLSLTFGDTFPPEKLQLWKRKVADVYHGDEGRKKARMCMIAIRDRDSLLARLSDVSCPVTWLQGTGDPVFSIENAKDTVKFFTASNQVKVEVIENGSHFMSATHPAPIKHALLAMLVS